MLSRLSLNIIRLAQITPNKYAAALKLRQKSNYVSVAPNDNVSKSTNLQFIIKELKECVKSKIRLSNNDLESLLTNLKSQKCNSAQTLEILQCFSIVRMDKNQSDIVKSIWNELKNRNNDFQTKHYNYLIQCLRNRGDLNGVQNIFDEMINAKIQPDALSYQCLLQAYCKKGEIDRAIEVLGLMEKANLYINESVFNDLVQCHIIGGNLEGAYDVIESAKEAGHKVNVYTLGALLHNCAKSGDLQHIEKTFKLFTNQNVHLLNRDVFKAMYIMAINGYSDKIDELFSYLKPTDELKPALRTAVTKFVERNQSPIVPKIIRLAHGDNKEMVRHLIEEMVRCSTPAQEFNETIANIEAMSITIENRFDYFEAALEGSSEEVIQKLLNHMKAESIELSESVFERLIELVAKKGANEVLNVVEMMCTDFNIQPSISFVRDHILPALNSKENPTVAFAKLQTTKIRQPIITMAIIENSLINGDIQSAYEFAKNNKIFYGFKSIRGLLLSAFKTADDIKMFVSFIRLVYDSFMFYKNYYRTETLTKSEIGVKQKAFVGEILALAISNHCDNTRLILQLLKAFADEGFTITTEQAINIQKSLHVNDETEIGRLLKKLSTEPLKSRHHTPNIANKISSIQNVFDDKQTRGRKQMNATEKLEFLEYIRGENLAEIESLLASDKISLNNSDYAHLIRLYTKFSELEKAMSMLKRAEENDKDFKLDSIKVGELVALMIHKERDFSEIEEVLLKHRPKLVKFRMYSFELILLQLATRGYVLLAEKLFDALLKYHYVNASIELTGPLVLAHMKNGTFAEAVDKYDYLAKTFKLTPMTIDLFMELIKKKEMDLLLSAHNVYKELHGIEAAQAQLAFAFVRCGQEQQARSHLEHENLKNLTRYILDECKQYVKHGQLEEAKTLLSATRGLQCDRHTIYQTILEIYKKKNIADEALKLWHEYSTEDDILPKRQFQTKLIDLLKSNNMEIPKELQVKQ